MIATCNVLRNLGGGVEHLMAIGLSTSGTLFGIRAAEDTIRRLQGRSLQSLSAAEKDSALQAMATLLRASAVGNAYRPPVEIRALHFDGQ